MIYLRSFVIQGRSSAKSVPRAASIVIPSVPLPAIAPLHRPLSRRRHDHHRSVATMAPWARGSGVSLRREERLFNESAGIPPLSLANAETERGIEQAEITATDSVIVSTQKIANVGRGVGESSGFEP